MSQEYEDQPVRVFKRFYNCKHCGNGHLEWSGITVTSYPAQYPHHCLRCGQTSNFMEPSGSIHYEYGDNK